jgi:hypothetical protein
MLLIASIGAKMKIAIETGLFTKRNMDIKTRQNGYF